MSELQKQSGRTHTVRPRWTWIGLLVVLVGLVLVAIGIIATTWAWAVPGLVLLALAVDGVPIDVLAERLNTTRGALYKTLHDARRKLRRCLAADGLLPPTTPRSG